MIRWLQQAYRWAVPARWRTTWVLRVCKRLLYRVLPHDVAYSKDFFIEVMDGPASSSAPTMAQSIVDELHPHSVIDVGCGSGALLAALRDLGVRVHGFEKAKGGLAMCAERGLDVTAIDLATGRFPPGTAADVAVCFEVAEHIPARFASHLVSSLTGVAPVVLFSAAPPGQGGTDHVNEQPACYWADLFSEKGYSQDRRLQESLVRQWRASANVADWYTANLLVFRVVRE